MQLYARYARIFYCAIHSITTLQFHVLVPEQVIPIKLLLLLSLIHPHTQTLTFHHPLSKALNFHSFRDTHYIKPPKTNPCRPRVGWWSASSCWAARGGSGSAAPTLEATTAPRGRPPPPTSLTRCRVSAASSSQTTTPISETPSTTSLPPASA